jgi:hypothetical protein
VLLSINILGITFKSLSLPTEIHQKMSLKRAISLSFLFFANVVVLAHVAMPHHYHEKTGVCFSIHCKDCREAHCHEPNETSTHHHEGNPSSDKCSFDNIYIPEVKNEKYAACLHVKFDYGFVQIANANFVENAIMYFQQKSYVPFFYSYYISRSIGLRAPPVC